MEENKITPAPVTELERSGNGVMGAAPPDPTPLVPAEPALDAPEEDYQEDFDDSNLPEDGAGLVEDFPPEDYMEEPAPAPEQPQRILFGRGKNSPYTRGARIVKPGTAPKMRSGLTPEQKLLLLDTWERSGLPIREFASVVNISRHSLYKWRQNFNNYGPEGLVEKKRGAPKETRLPEATKRAILMLKEQHPEYGCQRISDLLMRGMAIPASSKSVAKVLYDSGYELEESPTKPHAPATHFFERAKPNQLWQSDLFTFILKRQNRRVYMVAFMDDHSRFITGYGVHASQSGALVIEVLRAGIASYGAPQELLTDNGAQYITWRGKSAFTKELQARGIKHIIATPKRPQTLGKVERFWGTLWRECVETAVFLDLEDARKRIGLFIDHYNFQRPHQGINGLVPADRFFNAAPEVFKALKERVAANSLDLSKNGIPKAPFYLTGNVGGRSVSVHAEGEKIFITDSEGAKREVAAGASELMAQPPASAPLPVPVCPHGSPGDVSEQSDSNELPPGVSPLDECMDEGIVILNEEPVSSNVEGVAHES